MNRLKLTWGSDGGFLRGCAVYSRFVPERHAQHSRVFARARRLLLFVGLVFAALPVGSALADIGIGQTGAPREALATGDEAVQTGATVPTAGTITSFQTQSGSFQTPLPSCQEGGTYNFQVLRPLGNDQYRVLGDTGDQSDPCDGQFYSIPVTIPVQAGDVLGVYVAETWAGIISETGSVALNQNVPEPAVGQTITVSPHLTGLIDEGAVLAPAAGGPPPPTSKNQCKHGGWKNFSQFKNQGACVSFVDNNPPSGQPRSVSEAGGLSLLR